MRSKLNYIQLLFILLTITVVTANGGPTSEIKSTISTVLDTMRDTNLSIPENSQKRRQTIRSLIRDRFAFKEMAKRSLARHWKKRTPEEKKEFVAIFSDLLEASYISKIEAYTDEKITYDKETIKGKGK